MPISINRNLLSNSNSVLRTILNKKENLDISKKMIEDILCINVKQIIFMDDLKKDNKEFFPKKKYGIAIFRVVDEKDTEYNIGIQIIDGYYVPEKLLKFASYIHANQELYGTHNQVVTTITINFLDNVFFPSQQFHNAITYMDPECREYLNRKIKAHLIELPKFSLNEISQGDQPWVAYIKGDDIELIKKSMEICKEIKRLDDEIVKYWRYEELE